MPRQVKHSLKDINKFIDIVDQDMNDYMEFHSHFSDDSRQDSSTTHSHMVSMLTDLRKNN